MSIAATKDGDRPERTSDYFKKLALLICFLGVLVRTVQYLSNRSLWNDELNLVLNIVNRSYLELLQPLDNNQAAPPGFLLIEKLATQLFSENEYALRLFPFIAGIISIFAFYKLASYYTSKWAISIALILFTCLRFTVYYSTEVKQYSSDIMVALLLALLLLPLRDRLLTKKQIFGVGLLGAIAIWFSHPAVFVLAGIELSHFLLASGDKRKALLLNRLPIYFIWILSFAALYFLTIIGILGNKALTRSWGERYPDSLLDFAWFFDSFGRFFYRPLGFLGKTDGVAIAAFVIGCVAYFRRDKTKLLILMAPAIVTVIASYLQKYPFRERLVLFLTPFFILVIAEGIVFLFTQIPYRYRYFKILSVLIAGLLLFPPLFQAGKLLIYPEGVQEIKSVIEYVKSQQKLGDVLFVDLTARNQFLYYSRRYEYSASDYILGETDLPNKKSFSEQDLAGFKQEVAALKGKSRVWFLLTEPKKSEEAAFLQSVNSLGQQTDVFRATGAIAYLYDLR